MNNQSVNEGQSVTFTAETSGVPVPTLSWQKDGRQIYPGGDHYQIHSEGNRSTLYIASVRPDDDAWYQCTAASVSGTATNRVRLHIIIGRFLIFSDILTFVYVCLFSVYECLSCSNNNNNNNNNNNANTCIARLKQNSSGAL